MRIVIHAHSGSPHHRHTAQIMADGLRAHGMTDVHVAIGYKPVPCALAVMWGHGRTREHIVRRQQASGADYLVMERGYLGDRHAWTSLGFGGLNGRAEFHNHRSPSDRWKRYFASLLEPWRASRGGVIVLMGQVPGDAATQRLKNLRGWMLQTARTIRDVSDKPIMFRPHPRAPFELPEVLVDRDGSPRGLRKTLKSADLVVTYNSNSGVDAMLAGIPVLALDEGSMVWDLAGHTISSPSINEPRQPTEAERLQWAYDMAYAQWSEEEIRSGHAWDHLKQRYA